MRNRYSFPLHAHMLTTGENLRRTEDAVSVRNHLLLLIMTSKGELSYDRNYGSSLWESDFDVCVVESAWASQMKETLIEAIKSNEPRIIDSFKIDVKMERESILGNEIEQREKYMIKISNIQLIETNEEIADVTHYIYFSPFNLD